MQQGSFTNKNKSYIGIDQIDYIKQIDPIPLSKKRCNNRDSHLDANEMKKYKSLIGQLNWIATPSRPDILLDVCDLSTVCSICKVADAIRANKVVSRIKGDHISIQFTEIDVYNISVVVVVGVP